jgi:hypothetical protein
MTAGTASTVLSERSMVPPLSKVSAFPLRSRTTARRTEQTFTGSKVEFSTKTSRGILNSRRFDSQVF